MNELQVFNNPQFGDIRTIELDGDPWFVGKDVARALKYKDTVNALKAHVDHEDKRGWQITTPSGTQEMTIINESGVYSLIFSSKLPKAKEFKRWVTSEVLPAIRKQGAYLTPEWAEKLETMNEILQALSERVSALEENARPGLLLEPPEEEEPQRPGLAARRRWMRTMNEKLDLLSERHGRTRNWLLHDLYVGLEDHFQVVLDEERIKAMEQYQLSDCSVLAAIFYNPELRGGIERCIDRNLAPENRGW